MRCFGEIYRVFVGRFDENMKDNWIYIGAY